MTETDPIVICGNKLAFCHCALLPGHGTDAHACACGESWTDDGEIVSYPREDGWKH